MRMRAPMLTIHTVAAGGGSILHFDGSRYRVGPGLGRRRSRPGLLPARRPAHRHRRQRHARPDPAGATSPRCSAPRRPAAGRRGRRREVRRAGRRDRRRDRAPASSRGGRRRVPGHRRGEHGQRDQEDLGAARLRRHPVRAGHVRRGGRPARLRGRRRAGHRPVLIHPLAGVLSAYGMGLADLTAMREQAVEAPLAAAGCSASWTGSRPAWRTTRWPSWPARARTRHARPGCAGRICATRAPTPRCPSRWAADGHDRRFERAYRQQFSFLMPGKAILVERSVEVAVRGEQPPGTPGAPMAPGRQAVRSHRASPLRMAPGACRRAPGRRAAGARAS